MFDPSGYFRLSPRKNVTPHLGEERLFNRLCRRRRRYCEQLRLFNSNFFFFPRDAFVLTKEIG